ncbi:MAG: LamB/YcsF family protein [Candidatus Hecatellaceae archaeon]
MAEKLKVDFNADMGESFGRYVLGNDEGLMKYITSANVACGFHAGDPSVMRRTVRLAKQYNVAVGAHPALPDLLGFGRREMKISPEELRDYLVYQVGALKAFAEAEGLKLQHVKPHGALYAMVERDESLAEAAVEAMLEVDGELIFVTEYGTAAYQVAKRKGAKVICEGFADLKYGPDGRWIIERKKEPWKPETVAQRALSMVKEGKIQAVDGSIINIKAETICIHGDAPNAVEIAEAVRRTLEAEGIEVVPMREIVKS